MNRSIEILLELSGITIFPVTLKTLASASIHARKEVHGAEYDKMSKEMVVVVTGGVQHDTRRLSPDTSALDECDRLWNRQGYKFILFIPPKKWDAVFAVLNAEGLLTEDTAAAA